MLLSNKYNCLALAFWLITNCSFSQTGKSQNLPQDEDYNLLISGGIHAGVMTFVGVKEVPYNIHVDKVLENSRYVVGAGYSCDFFNYNPLFYANGENALRQNFRVRIYKFNNDPEKKFVTYQGISMGLSVWKSLGQAMDKNPYYQSISKLPTLQFFAGFKLKINESLFWQSELAIGAPYNMETGFGVKF